MCAIGSQVEAPLKRREFPGVLGLEHLLRFDEGVVVGDLFVLLVDELAEFELAE
jgi:hypothetical protein